MICTCDPKGCRVVETEKLALAARLGVEPSMLAQAVWRGLHDDLQATVTVCADQWFLVRAEADGVKASTECDDPLDGLVFTWNQLAEAYPERVERFPSRPLDPAQAALSEVQLDACTGADVAFTDHQTTCGCKWPPCAEGNVLLDLRIAAFKALIDKWGKPLPEDDHAFYGMEAEE